MKIIVYECRDPMDLPDLATGKGAARMVVGRGYFVARIRSHGTGQGGKTVEMWHPVIFEAPTAAEVRAYAQSWWDTEVAKVDGRKAPKRKPMEAAPGPASPPEVDLVEEAV